MVVVGEWVSVVVVVGVGVAVAAGVLVREAGGTMRVMRLVVPGMYLLAVVPTKRICGVAGRINGDTTNEEEEEMKKRKKQGC